MGSVSHRHRVSAAEMSDTPLTDNLHYYLDRATRQEKLWELCRKFELENVELKKQVDDESRKAVGVLPNGFDKS